MSYPESLKNYHCIDLDSKHLVKTLSLHRINLKTELFYDINRIIVLDKEINLDLPI